ncbi:hypothetical protein DXG01_014845 [Tephrocybe rancida]|nr:hypothetical protein DXG01_014845 [Tephrocybe rancida]
MHSLSLLVTVLVALAPVYTLAVPLQGKGITGNTPASRYPPGTSPAPGRVGDAPTANDIKNCTESAALISVGVHSGLHCAQLGGVGFVAKGDKGGCFSTDIIKNKEMGVCFVENRLKAGESEPSSPVSGGGKPTGARLRARAAGTNPEPAVPVAPPVQQQVVQPISMIPVQAPAIQPAPVQITHTPRPLPPIPAAPRLRPIIHPGGPRKPNSAGKRRSTDALVQ